MAVFRNHSGVFVRFDCCEAKNSPFIIQCLASLARIIIYSMAPDSIPVPYSNAPTPIFSPLPSGVSTPHPGSSTGDYLSHSLGKKTHFSAKPSAYLGGSKALDSLARMIASTESFFHPTNSGTWTTDVGVHVIFIISSFVNCLSAAECFHQIHCL